jgi:hypothetical protein
MPHRYRVSALFLLVALLFSTSAVLAAPMTATISLGRDPEPPICVINSGGVIDITWNIEHTTTPNYVYFKIEDPTRTTILDQETYTGNDGLSVARQWTVPPGSVDGKYWVRVEYWSLESGNEANAEVTFYVCTDTGDLCGHKWQDVDRDANCADDSTPVESWWICITTPFNDTYCKRTGADGSVCWSGLIPGGYSMYEPPVSGWSPVGPSSYETDVYSGETTSLDFCNASEVKRGACCGPWGTVACILAYENWCVNQGGIFMGEGTTCGGGTCVTSTVPVTWGRIKALYK